MEEAAVAYLEELLRRDYGGNVFIEVRLLLFSIWDSKAQRTEDLSVRHLIELMSSKQD